MKRNPLPTRNPTLSPPIFPFFPLRAMPTSSSLLLLFLLISIASPSHSLSSDGLALLALRSAVTSDPSGALLSWSPSDPTPCFWTGVLCSSHRVVSLNLRGLLLSAYVPSELRLLSSLSLLDLSSNRFSGPLPPFLPFLPTLSGTLNLSFNSFSGEVPPSFGSLPIRVSLDLSHNNLSGRIPLVGSLINQGPTAFQANPGLCGFPLQNPCPLQPGFSSPRNGPVDPTNSGFLGRNEGSKTGGSKSTSHVLLVVTGVLVAVAASVCWSVLVLRRQRRRKKGGYGDAVQKVIIESGGSPGSNADGESEGQKGKYVVVDDGFELEMEELLRASAYVVGKSKGGIVYKVVVMGGGRGPEESVAVRRLSEGEYRWGFKEFEAEVEAISRVVHPNVVRLRAYYNANDEKLLVMEYVRNGSLHSALHGGPYDSLPKLSWAARLKILQGIARGLTYIHEHSPRRYVHGNLKSTKILLDDQLQPRISGFGLACLLSGASPSTASLSKKRNSCCNRTVLSSGMELRLSVPSVAHLAPEARISGNKLTQKCDVYSFGIILMEMLTGRLPDAGADNDGKGLEALVRKVFREERPLSEIIDPSILPEVHAKKQVIAAFHIALNCTELDPELRPRMRIVSENLDRMQVQ